MRVSWPELLNSSKKFILRESEHPLPQSATTLTRLVGFKGTCPFVFQTCFQFFNTQYFDSSFFVFFSALQMLLIVSEADLVAVEVDSQTLT